MKTDTQPKDILLKIILISIILIISTLYSFSQNPFKTFEISHDVTGSGLGENICISTGLEKNESTLSFGANFQKKKFNLSGFQVNYRYTVAKNEKLELYFSGNLTVHALAYLSKGSVRLEEIYQPELSYNYNTLNLNVIESYVGFGLKFNHSPKVSTSFNMGFGAYETLNEKYDFKMNREKSAVAMQVRLILIYNFKNRD